MYKLNSSIKVKTPRGFKKFAGIQKVRKPVYQWIIFGDDSEIKCSLDHSFGEEQVKAHTIKAGDLLQHKEVVYSEIVEEPIDLYDLLEVEDGNLYNTNGVVSHNCEFLGSVDTLIAPSKLKSLVYEDPIMRNAGLDVYEDPIKDHDYAVTVDVARGVGGDYSAFVVVDITSFPHKMVAKYRDNMIKPMLFPSVIFEVAKSYNDAWILCEVNDVGDQVACILNYDLEYPNLLQCSMRGRAGQIVGQGFSGNKTQLGVKMSKTVKKVGSLNLKTMIEEDKLIFNDYEVISELTTFIQKHNSFEAEEGCNDDLAMCLVIYAWLVAQDYFKELTDQDVRKRLYQEQKEQIEADMAPFGFISDGLDDETFVADGDRWSKATLDGYGETMENMSYMWDSW